MNRLLKIVAGTALVLVPLGAAAQQGGCNCQDARDLYTRHCAAQGAINEWNRLINRAKDRERGERRVIPALDMKEDVAKCTDEVISIYRQEGPGSRTSRGETDRNCNVTVNAANACMGGVIAHHESWHKMMCEAHNRPDAPWRTTANPFNYLAGLINRMSQQSLVDYMYEERTGYMLEVDYTRDRLMELAGRCNEPGVFQSTRQGRSYTLQPCPRPNFSDYNRQCSFK